MKKNNIFRVMFFITVLLAGTAFAGCGGVQAGSGNAKYPNYSENYYVSDYCSLLSDEAEKTLAAGAERVTSLTGMQVVIAAVPDTQELSVEAYSRQLANLWGVGSGNQGILILLVRDSGKIRIEVGKGLEKVISSETAGKILDEYAAEPLAEGKWNEAATGTCMAVAQTIYNYNGLTVPLALSIVEDKEEPEQGPTMADVDFEEASSGRVKSHGTGKFNGCGATRP